MYPDLFELQMAVTAMKVAILVLATLIVVTLIHTLHYYIFWQRCFDVNERPPLGFYKKMVTEDISTSAGIAGFVGVLAYMAGKVHQIWPFLSW